LASPICAVATRRAIGVTSSVGPSERVATPTREAASLFDVSDMTLPPAPVGTVVVSTGTAWYLIATAPDAGTNTLLVASVAMP